MDHWVIRLRQSHYYVYDPILLYSPFNYVLFAHYSTRRLWYLNGMFALRESQTCHTMANKLVHFYGTCLSLPLELFLRFAFFVCHIYRKEQFFASNRKVELLGLRHRYNFSFNLFLVIFGSLHFL